MSDIKPTDVISHIVNSMDNDGSNYYLDDEGLYWVVSSRGLDMRVDIYPDAIEAGEPLQSFILKAEPI
jgi:hypothetical protein